MNRFGWLDVVKIRKFSFVFSAVIILLTIVFSFVFGVEFDIQFKGGTIITYSYTGEADLNAIKGTVDETLGCNSNVTKGTSIGDANIENITVEIDSTEGINSDKQSSLTNALHTAYPDNNLEILQSQDVAASSGISFFYKCLVAVALASIFIIIYVALRFKKIGGISAGVCAIIALLHDVIVVYATMVFTRMQIDSNFMAAVLIILGYSVNDTIIIYDRLRENRKIYGKKLDTAELVNISVRQTLARTINTTLTTMATVLVMCIVCYAYNISSIYSLLFPLLLGMISGTYSTIFIACPIWVMWKNRQERVEHEKKVSASRGNNK